MRSEERMPEGHGCGEDAAAYVLGALEGHEAQAFAEHLTTCASCRSEVAALQHVADALPLAAPQHRASDALRRSVLAQVRAEPRQTPRPGPDPDPIADPGLIADPSRVADPGRALAPGARAGTQRGPRRRRPVRLLGRRPALAGILAVAVAAVCVIILRGGGTGTTRVYASTVGSAKLYLSDGHARLVVAHLPQAPSGRTYEVWLQRGDSTPAPANALFDVSRSGRADVAVPGTLRSVSAVLVSQEPAGGSPRPTSRPVIITPLG